MRTKLTAKQKYNREYYQKHKGEPRFEARRARNAKEYRSKKTTKRKRNARLRAKWASDPEYRRRMSEYQKAWRRRKKLASAIKSKKSKNSAKRTGKK